jgi:multidrug efflux pump subunit AcrB
MNFSAPFVVRPIATTLLTIGLTLLGLVAYFLLPIAGVPQVDIPTIRVSAKLPGANAERWQLRWQRHSNVNCL